MKVTKQRSQRAHAKRRAVERFGLDLNRHAMKALVEDIQKGRAIFVEKQSHRVSKVLVRIGEKWIPVIYDKIRKTIVTFLPIEAAP